MKRIVTLTLTLACSLVTRAALAQSTTSLPEANPGRPTVSGPAKLTPIGYVQIETGVTSASDSLFFSSRFGAAAVAKVTVHSRVQAIAQFEPVVRSRVEGDASTDRGGFSAGAQVVLLPGTDTRPTVSVSYQRSLNGGASPDGDLGSSRQSAFLLVSGDIAGFHIDANGIVSDALVGDRRVAQYGETICVSHPVGPIGIAGEWWRFAQPFLPGHAHTAGTLWAVSYQVRPNLVLDGGVNRGLRDSSTQWQVMAGLTYVVPKRLW